MGRVESGMVCEIFIYISEGSIGREGEGSLSVTALCCLRQFCVRDITTVCVFTKTLLRKRRDSEGSEMGIDREMQGEKEREKERQIYCRTSGRVKEKDRTGKDKRQTFSIQAIERESQTDGERDIFPVIGGATGPTSQMACVPGGHRRLNQAAVYVMRSRIHSFTFIH